MLEQDVFDVVCIEIEHMAGDIPIEQDELLIEYGAVDKPIDLSSAKNYDISVRLTERETDDFEILLHEVVTPCMHRLFEMLQKWNLSSYVIEAFTDLNPDHDYFKLDRNVIYFKEIVTGDVKLAVTYHIDDGEYTLSVNMIIVPV